MIKIALKEPVTSGFMPNSNEYFERGMVWLNVQGKIDETFKRRITHATPDEWLDFVEPGGNPVLVQLSNIAYFQEQIDGANQ